MRRLDKLDAEYGLGAYPRPRATSRGVPVNWIAGVATLAALSTLLLIPGAVPQSLRSLVGFDEDRVLPEVEATTAGEYSFMVDIAGSSEPMRWDPCVPIRYEVNPEGASSAAVKLVHEGIAETQSLTGLRFDYVGETDRRPQWRHRFVPELLPGSPPVLVSWATEAEVPDLAGDVVGLGGAAGDGGGAADMAVLTQGGVTFDVDFLAEVAAGQEGRAQQWAVVLHELGHLVGLGHVDDPRELMARDNTGQLGFGPGDRKGLALAGQGPCE